MGGGGVSTKQNSGDTDKIVWGVVLNIQATAVENMANITLHCETKGDGDGEGGTLPKDALLHS